MKRITQVIAIAAALAAFPALAQEAAPIPGSDRDPFSQTYDGQPTEKVQAQREKHQRSACDRSCACGHHRAKQEPTKA